METVKAKGFQKVLPRHARTKHWRHYWRTPAGRAKSREPNATVCHGCHTNLPSGAFMFVVEDHRLCFSCYGHYVRFLDNPTAVDKTGKLLYHGRMSLQGTVVRVRVP